MLLDPLSLRLHVLLLSLYLRIAGRSQFTEHVSVIVLHVQEDGKPLFKTVCVSFELMNNAALEA